MRTIVVVFAFFVAAASAYNATLYTTKEAIKDHYIVVLQPDYDVEAVKKKISTDTSGIFKDTIIKWTYKNALNGFAATLSPAALQKVRSEKAVKYVSQDGVARTQAVASWGLDRVDQRNLPLDGLKEFAGDGKGVNVYVIDTGIYPESIYFEGRAFAAWDFEPNRADYGIDCQGHGTHCAGTVGSNLFGVAPGVHLYGVRVLGCDGSGSWSSVIAGCDYVATSGVQPAVASMSIGGPFNQGVDDAVRGVYDAGITVVAAAGNSNDDACSYSPAGSKKAMTIGATDSSDNKASFSNYGTCVDLFAPGVDIPSSFIGGPEEIRTYSGTSMACPHVSGAAAILLGNDPTIRPHDVREWIYGNATAGVVKGLDTESPNLLLYVP